MSGVDPEQQFLVLAPTGRDAALTCELLERGGMAGVTCTNMASLCQRFSAQGALGLMIAEEALTPRALRALRQLLDSQPPWSDLPVLVFAGLHHQLNVRPSAQLLANLGNVALLDRPLRPVTMLSAANAARRSRLRQYAARTALEHQQRAVKQRDQFLAMLGHELRNPLAAITMAAELDDGDSQRCRDIVRRQARHLTRLVDDLLDVSRVTSGKIVLQRKLLDARQVVDSALQAAAPTLTAHALQVTVEKPDYALWVDADPVRLEQVLVNLLANAAKYSGGPSRAQLVVRDEHDRVCISVRDEGLGISPDILPRVFDLFEQAHSSLDRAQGGMGIGLTLVRSLVMLHGGSVDAHSDGLGLGSTFTVRLPKVAHQGDQPAPATTSASSQARARNVLIVEDNEDSRELLAAMLARVGHHVQTADNGVQGVALALRTQPEVLLVDIGLPGLDGYGVASQVRRQLGERVYLVALTGYGQPEDKRRALDAGFDVHLTKPVDIRQLEQLLRNTHAAPTRPQARAPG